MIAALLSPAVPAFTLSRRFGVASEARMGVSSRLAGRLCASGLFGAILEEPTLGLLDPLARRAAREERVDAAHGHSSILIACGNRVMPPSDAAASTCNPSAQEV